MPPHVPAPIRRLALASGLVLAVLWAAVPALAQPLRSTSATGLARHEHAVVALDGSARSAALVRRAGGTLAVPRLHLWRLTGKAAARVVPRLRALGALRYAEPERARPVGVHFVDPLTTPDIGWHLYAVGADRVDAPGPGFPITVIDSGIDLGHMDFAGRPNTIALNAQATDFADIDEYHGTLVSSTAAAASNGVGSEGVYPQAVLREYDVATPTSTSVAAGIEAAVAAGPSVINLSLGGPVATFAEEEAVLDAVRTGSIVVAASGNSFDQGNPPQYPAQLPHVLTVGAVDRSLQPASFSSSGPGLDLVAPGVDIPFAHPTDPEQSVRLDGTSFSAPIVSAAAAWLKTARPTLAAGQVMDVLRHSADDIGAPGWDSRSGWGLLNVPNALVGPTPPVDPLEPNDDVEQVNGGVGPAQRSIDGPRGGNVRIAASVDAGEDPHDIYRVVVPAKRRLVVTVAANANLRAALWTVNAFTVRVGRDGRLAVSNRPGTRSEQVAWTNPRKTATAVFLDVSPAGAGIRGRYTAAVRIVRAPR